MEAREAGTAETGTPTRRAPYSVKEVAAHLGVSGTTVYYEISRGELPAMAIGSGRGTYRVEVEDLEAYKARCRERAVRQAM